MSASSTVSPDSPSANNLGEVFFQPSPPNSPPVQVRLPDGKVYLILINAMFDVCAAQMFASARNRRLFGWSAPARVSIAEMFQKILISLGFSPNVELAAIALAGFVNIGIPAALPLPRKPDTRR